MTDYFYDMDLVVDPLNPANVVRNGLITLYDPADTEGLEPLAITDPSGVPLPNPIPSNDYGYLPPRIVSVPQTMWKSGDFTGYFNSYKGLRDEAVAARTAAEIAQAAATTAGADAAAVVEQQLAATAADAAASKAAAAAAQVAAEAAAATSTGGGVALDPTDPDVLLISTKADGTVVPDPSDSDALIITI